MKNFGYIEADGSYNERPQKISKAARIRAIDEKTAWWNSLTEAEREIIKWCRSEECPDRAMGIAQCRERYLDDFYRHMTGIPQTPKKKEKYELVWNNMEKFKEFVKTNQ